MPIQISCECGRTILVKEQYAGRRAKCPGCGAALQIPAAPAPAPLDGPDFDEPPPIDLESAQTADPMADPAPGVLLAPPGPEVTLPTAVAAKLRSPALPPCLLQFTVEGADINADFDISPLFQSFADALAKKLRKTYDVQIAPAPGLGPEPTPALSPQLGTRNPELGTRSPAPAPGPLPRQVSVYVGLVQADQGNRFLRYFLGWLAGATVLQMAGQVVGPSGRAVPFDVTHKGHAGIFGGAPLGLMKASAAVLAAKVAKTLRKVT